MANFTYGNITITNAATLTEAKLLAATAWLRQFNEEPTQQQIDDLLAEIEAEESERVDFDGLEADITSELTWIDTTLAAIDGMTVAQVRDVVKRILQEQNRELRAWRFVIRKLR